MSLCLFFFFFFQAEDGIRDLTVTGVQTCALPISERIAAKRHENFSAIGKSLEDRVDFVSCFTFHVKRNRRIELVKWSRAYGHKRLPRKLERHQVAIP